LIGQKRLDRAAAQRCPAPANDVELAAWLISEGLMSREAIDETIVTQIENIIIDALTWGEGEWLFSPLARIRPDMSYRIDVHKVLINYARCIPLGDLNERFRSVNEVFRRTGGDIHHPHLQNHEEAILREFGDLPLTIEELRTKNAMPEQGLLQALYVLWLGGLLERREWSMAISPARLADIRNAKITLARQATTLPTAEPPKRDETPQASEDRSQAVETAISMEEYLTRAEGGLDHYELLGLTTDAEPAAIKAAYFGLAKLFHPDRFHREDAETQRRIQTAFTGIAHAYESLKTPEARKAYDHKLKSEAEKRDRRRAAGVAGADGESGVRAESSLESFDEGIKLLDAGNPGGAAAHFARAVHYSPENAKYHAYYGKALSFSDKHRHKAESELQAAVKLAPKDAEIRLMLVDLFLNMNMTKRAEGELRRLLEAIPGSAKAEKLLSTIASGAA
jgi:curved DNA-binding protein CbpA